MLALTIYSVAPGDSVTDPDLVAVHEDTVEYVSLYNGETHGPPALVAPGRVQGAAVPPLARSGDSVFYINTALVPAFKIERLDD